MVIAGRWVTNQGEGVVSNCRRIPHWWIGLALVPGLSPLAQGGGLPDGMDSAYFSDLPKVLTVSRLVQPASEAPGSVTVIDREMIKASAARNVGDLMRLVPGFQVAPPSQESPRITYHGLGEEYPPRVQVLIDGRSQYSPFYYGGVNWGIMPVAIEDIERIEVIRGSNSAAYGSNAFLGVVNIITQHSSQAHGGVASISSGNQGTRDKFARWGGGGDGVDYRLTYESREDEGLNETPDNHKSGLVDIRADWRLSSSDEIRLGLGHIRSDVEQGFLGRATNPLRYLVQEHTYYHVGWQRALSSGEEIAVRYYRNEDRAIDSHMESYGPWTVPIDYGASSTRDDFEFQHTLSPWRDTRLVWGLGDRRDTVTSLAMYNTRDRIQKHVTRVFGNMEWRPHANWVGNIGATLERDGISGTTLAPRININHHLAPGHTLRVGASRSYRTPSFLDTKGDWRFVSTDGTVIDRFIFSDRSVAPEKIVSREIGYVGELRQFGVSLDVRAFWETIPNRIMLLPRELPAPPCDLIPPVGFACGTADYAVNAQNIGIRGLEYQLRWQPRADTRVLLNQSFTYLRAENLSIISVEDEEIMAGHQRQAQTSAPTHSTSIMLMQKLPWDIDLSIAAHAVGAMKWTRNSYVNAYHRVDWRLAKTTRFGGQKVEISYTAQASNSDHGEFRSTQRISPRHQIGVRIAF